MLVWRWTKTRYGPLNDQLQGRKGQRVRVVTRGRDRKIWAQFDDGYNVITSRWAVRRAGDHEPAPMVVPPPDATPPDVHPPDATPGEQLRLIE